MQPATTTPPLIDEPIRVVLIGSERVTRAGLRMLIDSQPGLRVVGEVGSPAESDVWSAGRPQIAVIDIDRPEHDDVIPGIRGVAASHTRIIVLTSTPDSETCAQAIQGGILGVVSKQQAPEILIKAIERVHAGEVWLNRAKVAGVLGSLRTSARGRTPRKAERSEVLSQRERQIITLVGQGFRNAEIAASIFVSEATVRNSLGTIFRKLGISNRVYLMIYAIQEGFVNLPTSDTPPTPASPRDVLRLATSAGRPAGERDRT